MGDTGTVIDYRYPVGSDTRRDTPVIAIILIGLTSLTLGIFRLGLHIDFLNLDTDTLAMLLYILCASMLALACRSLRNHIITESIVIILFSFSAILYTISSVQNDSGMLSSLILFALGFVASAVIFQSRKEVFMAGSSATIAVILIAGAVFNSDLWMVPVGLMIIVGIGFILVGGLTLAGIRNHAKMVPSTMREISEEEFPEVLVSTVGVLLFGIMSFSVGIRMIDESGLLVTFVSFKLFMGLIVFAIGVYATYHGITGEGMTMMLVAMSSVVYALSMLLYGSVPQYLDLFFGLFLMPVSLALFHKKDFLLALTSFFLALVMIIGAFWEDGEMMELVVIASKVVATALALISWYTYDMGRKPLFIQYIEDRLGIVIE